MSEYHKIETLYERDEKTFRLKAEMLLKNPVYGVIKTWEWTEKIDGTNIRVIWSPFIAQCGHVLPAKDSNFCPVCGSKVERLLAGKVTFGGKSDNAQIHADLIKWLYENVNVEELKAVFPDTPA